MPDVFQLTRAAALTYDEHSVPGEATIDAVVRDVAAGLADHARDDVYVVPQEAHLFCATKPAEPV